MAVVRLQHLMGMPVVVDIRDAGAGDDAADTVFDWLRWVDETFSTYKADSEVSRIARGELDPADAHPDVQWVLLRCHQLHDETRGYFDLFATGSLDPSGLVKGWCVGRAAKLLEALGCRDFAVDAGGDMVLRGGALPAQEWRVGIQHPHDPMAVAAVVAGRDLAVATSGAYNRGDHVIDPHTGQPAPRSVLSVTVTGPDLGTADAYATAAFAMGEQGPHWVASLRGGYEALVIMADGRVLSTAGFPRAGDEDRLASVA